MKARDLAALAALGIAGKMAYDKFGGKGEAKKDNYDREGGNRYSSPVVEDSESNARINMRDMNKGYGRRDAGGNTEDVDRSAGVPERMRDMNEGYGRRDAGGNTEDVDRRAGVAERMGQNAAGSRFTDRDVAATPVAAPVAVAKPVRTPVVESRSLDSVGGPSRYNRAADSNAAGATFSSTEEGMKRNVPRRPGQASSQAPTFSSSEAGMKNYVLRGTGQTPSAVQQTPKPAAPVVPAAQTGRYTKDQYGNIIDNTTGKVSRTIFSTGQEGNAARNGMKRGGVVKMARGGLASSKPSSASSRGDGIAQRGKTRGTMR